MDPTYSNGRNDKASEPKSTGSRARKYNEDLTVLENIPTVRTALKRQNFVSLRLEDTCNKKAYLVQERGILMEGEQACFHCRNINGPWKGCVTLYDSRYEAFEGSCANCAYNYYQVRCDFHKKTGTGTNAAATDTVALSPADLRAMSKTQLQEHIADTEMKLLLAKGVLMDKKDD